MCETAAISVGTFQLRTRVSTDGCPTGTVNNKPSGLFLRVDKNVDEDSALIIRGPSKQLDVTAEASILLVPVSKRQEFVMDSCRRTGLSGVLCSLSLLCVLLDIQLDGKIFFFTPLCNSKFFKAFSHSFALVWLPFRVIKSFLSSCGDVPLLRK